MTETKTTAKPAESEVLGRRAFLRGATAGSLATFLGAQSVTSAMPSVLPGMLRSSCVLTPTAGSGPFYKALGLIRRDIRETKQGLKLTIIFRVVRASDCSPVAGAFVDLWHNDSSGTYSAFTQQGTLNETWLRGAQQTSVDGYVKFETVYPGWYPGRTCHLHAKVYEGQNVFTTQLFMPDIFSERVWAQPPYSVHGTNPIKNIDDTAFLPETVFEVRALGMSALPFMGKGMKRAVAAQTLVLA